MAERAACTCVSHDINRNVHVYKGGVANLSLSSEIILFRTDIFHVNLKLRRLFITPLPVNQFQ